MVAVPRILDLPEQQAGSTIRVANGSGGDLGYQPSAIPGEVVLLPTKYVDLACQQRLVTRAFGGKEFKIADRLDPERNQFGR